MSTSPPKLFDTDVLSCFAWVDRMDILETLYPENLLVLPEVIYEISRVQHLKNKIEDCVNKKALSIVNLDPLGNDGQEFAKLRGENKYGYGEAASMAYARYKNVIVSSNNLKDVLSYCTTHSIALISTRRIMYEFYKNGGVSMDDCENLWAEMIRRKRKLPCSTFKEAFEFYENGNGKDLKLHKY